MHFRDMSFSSDDSDDDSDYPGPVDPFRNQGNFESIRQLRGRTSIFTHQVADFSRTTRSGVAYHTYNPGSDTTAETREAAQHNVPVQIRNSWATSSGDTGNWTVDNPPPQRRGNSWASWGAALGAGAGVMASRWLSESFITSTVGATAGRAFSDLGMAITAPLGAAIGYGLGSIVDHMTMPRYDAGHTRSKAIGGIGDRPEHVFGQNPQFNRGQPYYGQPTYDLHRRHEVNEVSAVRRSATSLHTTTLVYRKKNS